MVILPQRVQGCANKRCPQCRVMFLVTKHSSSACTRRSTVILCEAAKLYITQVYIIWITACDTRDKGQKGISGVRRHRQWLRIWYLRNNHVSQKITRTSCTLSSNKLSANSHPQIVVRPRKKVCQASARFRQRYTRLHRPRIKRPRKGRSKWEINGTWNNMGRATARMNPKARMYAAKVMAVNAKAVILMLRTRRRRAAIKVTFGCCLKSAEHDLHENTKRDTPVHSSNEQLSDRAKCSGNKNLWPT